MLTRTKSTAILGIVVSLTASGCPDPKPVDSSKPIETQADWVTAEAPRSVGGRNAYELLYEPLGQSESSGQQLIQVVGQEAISVTC
jgi:hypothetical protein